MAEKACLKSGTCEKETEKKSTCSLHEKTEKVLVVIMCLPLTYDLFSPLNLKKNLCAYTTLQTLASNLQLNQAHDPLPTIN